MEEKKNPNIAVHIEVDEELKAIIEEYPLAFSTVCDNKPYTIVVAFAKVEDGKLILTDNYMHTAIENLKKNKNVSLAVWDIEWDGWQINGEAEYYSEGKWLEFVKSIPENEGEPCKGAIVIKINKIKELG